MEGRAWRLVQICCCLAVLLVSSGCASDVSVSAKPVIQGGERLLVLPFTDLSALHGAHTTVRSPVTGKVFETGPVARDAGSVLNDHLLHRIRSKSTFQTVAAMEAGRLLQSITEMREAGVSEIRVLTSAGRSSNADLVMAGYLYRFKERDGGRYSVKSPASVAFELHLVRVADGELLWSGDYNETQLPLSEDLLKLGTFIQRGAKWITAAEMARPAINKMVSSLVTP